MPSKSRSGTSSEGSQSEPAEMRQGRLVLIGTPLGNRGDLSPRALEALFSVDLLLCENTESPLRLVAGKKKYEDRTLPHRVSCFVANEFERRELLLNGLGEGKVVGFVSEAGMPVWSDPGQHLVQTAIESGFEVEVIPGPTAGSMALALSGFPAQGSVFWGFLARSGNKRKEELAALLSSDGPAIIYEAGNRSHVTLADLAKMRKQEPNRFGGSSRKVVIARELTKKHEEVIRGSLDELADRLTGPLRGEVTIVLDGKGDSAEGSDGADAQKLARDAIEILLDTDRKPKARAKEVAQLLGVDARELYSKLNRLRDPQS